MISRAPKQKPLVLVPQYLEMAEKISLQRMVVVQASVSGAGNAGTLDAVRRLGLHRARGVAVIDDSFDAAALRYPHDQGIRGAAVQHGFRQRHVRGAVGGS
jgi:predicted TIM-barrel fold metal-dependent hydrolase